MRLNRLGVGPVLIIALFATSTRADERKEGEISFAQQVRPIFNQHCIACHGGIKRTANLSFVYRDTIVGERTADAKVVVAGDPNASELIARVTAPDDDERMPPAEHGDRLSPAEIGILRQWIAEGALWETHWAFKPPSQPELPRVSQPEWCQSKLDFFVLRNLDEKNLRPSKPADPATWLRRVSFDLIGLPPTEAELDEFLTDSSSAARTKAVDRLLASPQFGERWATPWLDLARYADTMGFEKDPPRNIWPYRDWVIRALNDDMRFDQFTIKQIAGDLLPAATIDDRLATAFHRNTQANTEGGTDDEEFRVAAVIDRTNTTAQVWLGLTLGCAQCHDHPYEPISQQEYYQFMAFFNNTRDCDTNEEFPLLAVPYDTRRWDTAGELDRQIASMRKSVADWCASKELVKGAWKNATIESATATGSTRLEVVTNGQTSEIRTNEALMAGSDYTVECAIPMAMQRITAICIQALPLNEELAAKVPQTGFILSRLKLFLVDAAGEAREIPLQFAFDDDPEPFYAASESLDPNLQGWSSYPKQSKPCRAVFVPGLAVECRPGAKLRFVLEHHSTSEHIFQIRRARFWLSDSADWLQLIEDTRSEEGSCELAGLVAQRSKINSIAVPVLSELPINFQRTTRVFHRGSFLEPTVPVPCAGPEILPSIGCSHAPPTSRSELACWLAWPGNPLTGRVFVNRVWSEIFGRGIVESIENFGSSGSLPTNQALLDHLTTEFQAEFHWSFKRLLREIVLSSTYSQDAAASQDLWEQDANNRWLARGPRNRLTAEMIRDQALAVSGLLSKKMYGFPVMPPQPDGLWQSAYSGETWHTSTGEDRYRRAIYTYCKRTSGYPGLQIFDTPTRDVCVVKRIPTNTPLQALVTLNDAAFVELAQVFGERIRHSSPNGPRDKIAWGYRVATSQVPGKEKLDLLEGLYRQVVQIQSTSKSADGPDAFVMVAASILNLDETLTK